MSDYNEEYDQTFNHISEKEGNELEKPSMNENTTSGEAMKTVVQMEKPKKKHSFVKGVAFTAAVALASFGAGSLVTSYQWMQKYEAEAKQVKLSTGTSNNIVQTGTVSSVNGLNIAQIASKNIASVVEITTEDVSKDSFFGQFVTKGAGSGVIITNDGYIATNNHVIQSANVIKVRLSNGEEYTAKLVGTDSQTDVAVIKIECSDLQAVEFGDSDSLIVGEDAIAIGNPLGELGGTVTNGIISALDREINVSGRKMHLLQTNAAINPGNSGGGLFNSKGELIGLVVAKSTGSDIEGLGFAIPANKVKAVAESLINNGYVSGRPALGVNILDATSWQVAMQYNLQPGVYIKGFTEGGNAEKAGLKIGDIIVAVENTQITAAGDVTEILSEHNVGDTVEVTVSRDGKFVNIKVKLTELKPVVQEETKDN